jgi:hypothetical protein
MLQYTYNTHSKNKCAALIYTNGFQYTLQVCIWLFTSYFHQFFPLHERKTCNIAGSVNLMLQSTKIKDSIKVDKIQALATHTHTHTHTYHAWNITKAITITTSTRKPDGNFRVGLDCTSFCTIPFLHHMPPCYHHTVPNSPTQMEHNCSNCSSFPFHLLHPEKHWNTGGPKDS